MPVETPDFRLIHKEANAQAVELLEDLLTEAREGKVVGLAVAVDYGSEVRSATTASDNSMGMLAAIDRLHHKWHMWADEESPD